MKKIPTLLLFIIIFFSIIGKLTFLSLIKMSYLHVGLEGILKNPHNLYYIIPIVLLAIISIAAMIILLLKLNNYLVLNRANTLKEKINFILKNHKIISLIIGIILLQKGIIYIKDLI